MSDAVVGPTQGEGKLVDPFGREIRSMRLSVTQACDLACPHCHREGQSGSEGEMAPDEIERIVKIASSMGVRKLKITGGEPLLRPDIVDIVARVSGHVREVSMTTNGSRLVELAPSLARAGLSRVNVSLHSLMPYRNKLLCGQDLTDRVRLGIGRAVSSGLRPVKVNMVVFRGENDDEIPSMMEFCGRSGAVLQLIEYEASKETLDRPHFKDRFMSLAPLEKELSSRALETSVNELHRRNRYLIAVNGTSVLVEVVRPMHNTEFCANCTRIRMTSDGHLKPCLLDGSGSVDVLSPLRSGASDDELRSLFVTAAGRRKPYWS